MEIDPHFTFSALSPGSGGDDSSSSHKQIRTDDLINDKRQAVLVTVAESESPLLNQSSTTDSYAARLLNPLKQHGSAAIENFVMKDDDCQILT